jgi:muramoyltetrapeptide carboxypeptidase LdcA involved in peptidoglycan recycling
MRKLTATAVALGFFAATSLPTIAAPAVNTGVVKTDTLSAKEKTSKKSMEKSTKKSQKSMKKSTKKSQKSMKKSTKKSKKSMKKDEKKY